MPLQQTPSPLDSMSNLELVSQEQVDALHARLEQGYVPKVQELLRAQAQAAAQMRHKILF